MAYRFSALPDRSDGQGTDLQPVSSAESQRKSSTDTGSTKFERNGTTLSEQETEYIRELVQGDIHVDSFPNDRHKPHKSRWYWIDQNKYRDKSRRAKQKCWCFRAESWSWEVLGLLVSFSCMVAVAAILFKVQNSPLSLWTFSISPNTMVSVFITVAKSAMLVAVPPAISQLKWAYFREQPRHLYTLEAFDEACRGPWGAVQFLWGVKARARLASVGAVIVLIALAMDPFAQQILSFDSRAVETHCNDLATWMPTVDTFLPFSNESRAIDELTDPVTNMSRVILGGILGLERNLQWNCPTGNCTWTNFTSLGICSQCKDVSDTKEDCLLFSHHDAEIWDQSQQSQGFDENVDYCVRPQYTTPGNITLTLENGTYAAVDLGESNGTAPRSLTKNYTLIQSRSKYSYNILPPLPADEVQSDTMVNGTDLTYGDYKTPLLGRFAVVQPIHIPESLSAKDLRDTFTRTPSITECELNWCAKLYEKVEMINGIITETLSRNLPLVVVNQSDCWIVGKLTFSPGLPACQKFTIPGGDDLPPGVFKTFTVGNESNGAFGSEQYSLFGIMNFSASMELDLVSPETHPSHHLVNRNISEFVESTVNSINNYIRTGPGFIKQSGTAFREETFIIVDWVWFALPTFLVLLSIVFLASVICVTSRQGPVLWKSSNLPLVLYGLNGVADKDQPGVQSLDKIQNMSKRLKVQLHEGEDGEVNFICKFHV